MVAVNLNESQKPCELSEAYPTIQDRENEPKIDICLSLPVSDYGEVPDYIGNGLTNRAQAFGYCGMEEGDGLVDDDASEGSGESEGTGEGKDASDAKDASDGKDAPSAGGCNVDVGIDIDVDSHDSTGNGNGNGSGNGNGNGNDAGSNSDVGDK